MISFNTNLDLLYFALTIFVGCMTIFGSLLLIKAIRILADVQRISAVVKETAELVNEYAWKPIEILMYLKEYLMKHLKK